MMPVYESSLVTVRETNPAARLYRAVVRFVEERWLGGVHAGLVIKSLYLQRTAKRYLRQGSKKVLDAGCGETAQLANLLARRYPHCQVEGWDLHLATSAMMPSLRSRSYGNPILVEADLASLKKTAAYDLVYSIDVLEHIEDFQLVLDRLTVALRPGGMLFLHVPNLEQQVWFGPA